VAADGESPSAGPPSVSVIIPTFNRAELVCRAAESVLVSRASIELLVVDDGSTDDSVQRLAEIDDPRLRVIPQAHRGVSAARNRGIEEARGRLVVWLDSDDIAHPGWTDFWIRAEAEGADVASCGICFAEPDGRQTNYQPEPAGRAFGDLPVRFLAGAMGVDRQLLRDIGCFREGLAHSEHTELALRLAGRGLEQPLRCVSTDDVLVTANRREGGPGPATLHHAALAILEHEETHLQRSPELRATYLAIAGRSASKLGRRREAVGLLARAIRANPRSARNWARLVMAALAPLRGQGRPKG
jgi:glycosyltransferase involved in cell wall biosynthesis